MEIKHERRFRHYSKLIIEVAQIKDDKFHLKTPNDMSMEERYIQLIEHEESILSMKMDFHHEELILDTIYRRWTMKNIELKIKSSLFCWSLLVSVLLPASWRKRSTFDWSASDWGRINGKWRNEDLEMMNITGICTCNGYEMKWSVRSA